MTMRWRFSAMTMRCNEDFLQWRRNQCETEMQLGDRGRRRDVRRWDVRANFLFMQMLQQAKSFEEFWNAWKLGTALLWYIYMKEWTSFRHTVLIPQYWYNCNEPQYWYKCNERLRISSHEAATVGRWSAASVSACQPPCVRIMCLTTDRFLPTDRFLTVTRQFFFYYREQY